jgi:hypothetical protein
VELRAQLAAAGDHFLDEDAVVFRTQFEVVDDANLRNDEAELRGDLAADRLDLIGELAARGFVDEAEQAEAKFDLDVVDRASPGSAARRAWRVRGNLAAFASACGCEPRQARNRLRQRAKNGSSAYRAACRSAAVTPAHETLRVGEQL